MSDSLLLVASMVDGLGKAKFEDFRLQPALHDLGCGQAQHVVELLFLVDSKASTTSFNKKFCHQSVLDLHNVTTKLKNGNIISRKHFRI